jgi:hypothetical protein
MIRAAVGGLKTDRLFRHRVKSAVTIAAINRLLTQLPNGNSISTR